MSVNQGNLIFPENSLTDYSLLAVLSGVIGGSFQRNESVLDGKFYKAGEVVDAKLLHKVAPVGLDGLGR